MENDQTQTQETPTLEGLIASLGGPAQPQSQPTTTPETETPPAPTTTPTPETPPTPAGAAPEVPEPGTQTPPDTRAAHAFAQMRVQNSQLAQQLTTAAKLLGINETDPAKIANELQNRSTQQEAETQKVPVQLLQRMQQLEAAEQQRIRAQAEQTAFTGFQQLKDKYALSDTDLQNFARQLVEVGQNPFETQVDVVQAYKVLHFDDLMQQAEERGKQAEIQRATSAQQNSATVNGKDGSPATEQQKINTIASLDEFLSKGTAG